MVADLVRDILKVASLLTGPPTPTSRFRLTRYFVLTSLIAIAVVSPLIYLSEQSEEVFFEQVQMQQMTFLKDVQAEFVRAHDATIQEDVLKMHEASHVNLAHVFANMLWNDFLSPVVTRAQNIPIAHCKVTADSGGKVGIEKQSIDQRACFAKVGQLIMSLPRFAQLDAKVRATMRKSTVFKIKVFDLRGLTVYSSEHRQIGEDKSNNQGWRTAASGQAASELTHRERFSAFEGVVEDRDLISSYIPILNANNKVTGVFEIYSDATPFLKALQDSTVKLALRASSNQTTVESVASKNLERLNLNNSHTQIAGAGLLFLVYGLLLLIVHNGQRILDLQANSQANEQAKAYERERLWHQEKMAALAAMAANVAHETGNPLATISALAEDIEAHKTLIGCTVCQPKMILEQTERIVKMTRQIVDFATIRSEAFEAVDVNQMVKAVCDFLSFDSRFRAMRFDVKLGSGLPACVVIPDYLTEALMYLLQRCVEDNLKRRVAEHRIQVETMAIGGDVLIRAIFGSAPGDQASATVGAPVDSRFELARSRIVDIGGQLTSTHAMIEITVRSSPPHTDTR